MCVCVCMLAGGCIRIFDGVEPLVITRVNNDIKLLSHTHAHTHTHWYTLYWKDRCFKISNAYIKHMGYICCNVCFCEKKKKGLDI